MMDCSLSNKGAILLVLLYKFQTPLHPQNHQLVKRRCCAHYTSDKTLLPSTPVWTIFGNVRFINGQFN